MDDLEDQTSSIRLSAIFNSGKKQGRSFFQTLGEKCHLRIFSRSVSPPFNISYYDSDVQVETKRKRLFEEEYESPVKKEEPTFPQYARVDVEKEVEQLFGNPGLEAKVRGKGYSMNIQTFIPPPQIPKVDNMTSELQRSIDDFRSFLSENIV